MNFNFGEVLTRAWKIIWKHKVLWIFGILASCGRGGGGGGSGGGSEVSSTRQSSLSMDNMFEQLKNWIGEHVWLVVLLGILIIILAILFAFLGAVGKIGLIKGTYKAEQGAERLIFGELFSESIPYFWRVFGLSFLIGLVFLILFIPIILFGVLTAGIGFACLLPLICLLIPISLVVNVVIEQADNAMVLEDLGMTDGLRRGWEIVKSNVGPVLIMAIILTVITAVVGLIIVIPLIITLVPLIIGATVGSVTALLWIAGICCVVYFPFLLVLNGMLTAYLQSAWTLTYLRLTHKPDGGNAIPEIVNPVEPEDNNKTFIARPNA